MSTIHDQQFRTGPKSVPVSAAIANLKSCTDADLMFLISASSVELISRSKGILRPAIVQATSTLLRVIQESIYDSYFNGTTSTELKEKSEPPTVLGVKSTGFTTEFQKCQIPGFRAALPSVYGDDVPLNQYNEYASQRAKENI